MQPVGHSDVLPQLRVVHLQQQIAVNFAVGKGFGVIGKIDDVFDPVIDVARPPQLDLLRQTMRHVLAESLERARGEFGGGVVRAGGDAGQGLHGADAAQYVVFGTLEKWKLRF